MPRPIVSNYVRLKGGRLVTNLLRQVVQNFASRSVSFCDETNRFPFVYSEKLLNSVLLPSIADAANAVATEYPIKRTTRGRGSTFGFLDYWVFHHKTLLMVEMKHVWLNPRANKLRKRAQEEWQKAIRQTDHIPMSDIWADLNYTGLNASKIFRVPILVAAFYSSTTKKRRIKYEREDLINRHENIQEYLSPNPNWAALWLLKTELQGPYDWSHEKGGKFDSYPAVGFYSYVHRKS